MYTYLIVDDEMIERKGIRMLLSWMNIRENILEASNGEEALEVFEKEKIDVLLTDINMPFMDGIELLSRIHEEYPGTETVIFSGYDEFSYAKKAISYGVSAYILKPVNPEEFKKVVGEITEKLAKSEREEKRKHGVSAGAFAVSDGQRAKPQHNAGENTDASRYELCPGFLPYGTAGVCQQLF